MEKVHENPNSRVQWRLQETVTTSLVSTTCLKFSRLTRTPSRISSSRRKDWIRDCLLQVCTKQSLKSLNVFYAGKKGDKSGDLNTTLKLLVESFGGERALARKSPICAGRYNSTKANDVSSILILHYLGST